jgi:hypothetical protein
VVTILNVHKPRDRSHYERFAAYHRDVLPERRSNKCHAFLSTSFGQGSRGNARWIDPTGTSPNDAASGAMQFHSRVVLQTGGARGPMSQGVGQPSRP